MNYIQLKNNRVNVTPTGTKWHRCPLRDSKCSKGPKPAMQKSSFKTSKNRMVHDMIALGHFQERLETVCER